jgi:prepilin signal peptidase PulO-like enzyme (type II secretory pathway)
LRWFELVPLVSFLIQGGQCRRCKARLSIRYPIVELLSGLIFLFVPWELFAGGMSVPWTSVALMPSVAPSLIFIIALWVVIFEALLVMALIDIQMGIIPDEINIFLGVAGVFLAILSAGYDGGQGSAILARIIGAAVAGVFFALLIAITRGKGMGMGDLKLAVPLGLIFGWPDILFLLISAFVIGAAVGVLAIARGKNTMKGTLPFGPFLALGAVTAFFWGPLIIGWYFSLLGIG